MQIVIENCRFYKNYGINVAFGAAISIDGMESSSSFSQGGGSGEEESGSKNSSGGARKVDTS